MSANYDYSQMPVEVWYDFLEEEGIDTTEIRDLFSLVHLVDTRAWMPQDGDGVYVIEGIGVDNDYCGDTGEDPDRGDSFSDYLPPNEDGENWYFDYDSRDN